MFQSADREPSQPRLIVSLSSLHFAASDVLKFPINASHQSVLTRHQSFMLSLTIPCLNLIKGFMETGQKPQVGENERSTISFNHIFQNNLFMLTIGANSDMCI